MERINYCVKPSNFQRWFIRFLKFFAITGAAIVAVISAFLYFNVYLAAGTGPAGPGVPAEPFKQIWSQRPVLLLGIGDSITDGFGAPKGYSYFDRLIKNPPADNGSPATNWQGSDQ